jgi:hypothetical protein
VTATTTRETRKVGAIPKWIHRLKRKKPFLGSHSQRVLCLLRETLLCRPWRRMDAATDFQNHDRFSCGHLRMCRTIPVYSDQSATTGGTGAVPMALRYITIASFFFAHPESGCRTSFDGGPFHGSCHSTLLDSFLCLCRR